VALVLLGCAVDPPKPAGSQPLPATASSRRTVLVSDLHFGVGRDASGAWDAYEDFRWATEWDAFLRDLAATGRPATDLILNGDTFELWQSLAQDCRYADRDLGCSEAEALGRLQRVLTAHAPELAALGRFAGAGDNRVVIVPGNHDGALLFPRLAQAVVAAVPAPAGRVRVAAEGFWLSADGRIYAEHGHMIGEEVNAFRVRGQKAWPDPFIDAGGLRHIVRSWGEQFVQEYYNRWERRYPIIDNVADETVGIRYGIAAEGPASTVGAFGGLLKFLVLGQTWAQLRQGLGEQGGRPRWDLAAVRAHGARFVLDSLPPGDPIRAAVEAAVAAGTIDLAALGFTPDDLLEICDRRALLRRAQLQQTPVPARLVAECPREGGTLGAAVEYLLGQRDKHFGDHLLATSERLARAGRPPRAFSVFVFSHTHAAHRGFYPLRRREPAWDPHVVNTGAWQRVIAPEALAAIQAREGWRDAEVLTRMTLERLPACYSAVVVEPYTTRPAAVVRWWKETSPGRGALATDCS
jgi:UDP-2,3-diacylglucosamine pyrophosphatase LpxH